MNKFAINNKMFNQLLYNLLSKSIILIITLNINSTMSLHKKLLHLYQDIYSWCPLRLGTHYILKILTSI